MLGHYRFSLLHVMTSISATKIKTFGGAPMLVCSRASWRVWACEGAGACVAPAAVPICLEVVI